MRLEATGYALKSKHSKFALKQDSNLSASNGLEQQPAEPAAELADYSSFRLVCCCQSHGWLGYCLLCQLLQRRPLFLVHIV